LSNIIWHNPTTLWWDRWWDDWKQAAAPKLRKELKRYDTEKKLSDLFPEHDADLEWFF
jgi:hypothetical protein